ncbi:MAG: hypothetical protein K9M57_04235 [Phycisphaerae bacterium]|nr:hypothetical protein [Phycisphaerae bacterium]
MIPAKETHVSRETAIIEYLDFQDRLCTVQIMRVWISPAFVGIHRPEVKLDDY